MKQKPVHELHPEKLPETLKNEEKWILWRYEKRSDDNKWTKIPVNPYTGGNASSTDPDTWTNFQTALETHRNDNQVTSDGLGFVFNESDLYAGIDLDDCRDPETGELTDWATDIVEKLDSFTEISPSGTGLHVIIQGFIPDGGNRKDDVEMYDHARFFTMTGNHLENTPKDVKTRPNQLVQIHDKYIAEDTDTETKKSQPSQPVELEDREIIEKAKNADNGDKFEELWNGDTAAYENDHSRADQALCNLLAFWTGGDEDRIDDLFRDSGLCRKKWTSRQDYRERTISNAVQSCSEFYDPEQGNTTPEDILPEPQETGGITATIDWDALIELFEEKDITAKTARNRTADSLLQRYDFATFEDTEEIWMYNQPVYEKGGEKFVRTLLQNKLGDHIEINDTNQIIEKIRTQTFAKRPEPQDNKHLIALQNGVYDLDQDKFRDGTPEEIIITQLPVYYDEDADCPEIKHFLSEIVQEEDIIALQELIGYAMYSGYPHEKAWMLLGSGGNGKTLFLDLLDTFIGNENVASPSLHDLMNKDYAAASLYGKLANINGDLGEETLRSTDIFKRLSGGDTIHAREIYKEPIEFQNVATMIYAANTLPHTNDTTNAFFRRWFIIEFPYEFKQNPREDKDFEKQGEDKQELMESMKTDEELSGLFNFALKGLKRVLSEGFSDTRHTDEIKEEWLMRTNPLMAFVENHCETEPGVYIPKKMFWQAFHEYCQDRGAFKWPSMEAVGRDLPKIEGRVRSERPRANFEAAYGERPSCWVGLRVTGDYKRYVDQFKKDGKQFRILQEGDNEMVNVVKDKTGPSRMRPRARVKQHGGFNHDHRDQNVTTREEQKDIEIPVRELEDVARGLGSDIRVSELVEQSDYDESTVEKVLNHEQSAFYRSQKKGRWGVI